MVLIRKATTDNQVNYATLVDNKRFMRSSDGAESVALLACGIVF